MAPLETQKALPYGDLKANLRTQNALKQDPYYNLEAKCFKEILFMLNFRRDASLHSSRFLPYACGCRSSGCLSVPETGSKLLPQLTTHRGSCMCNPTEITLHAIYAALT